MATITSAGAVPASPTDLLNAEIAAATALAPGLTANLPGSLVEDMASTATGALVIQDQAYVDLVNSISPYTANPFILYQLGAVYGVQQGVGSNTSVYVTFTGYAGFVINKGFTVSDGTYQYVVQETSIIARNDGVIGGTGQSQPVYCLATTAGSWAVPPGTVTQIITSIPGGFNISCTNQTAGVSGTSAQTLQAYQAQVLQAGLVTGMGTPTFLKTQLAKVNGVQPRLISFVNQSTGGVGGTTAWQLIVGGGDPFVVAQTIYSSMPDIATLVGSSLAITGITNAYPGVVSTNINPNFTNGYYTAIYGVSGMTGINSMLYRMTPLTAKTAQLNIVIDSITWSGGVVTVITQNPHNLTGTVSGGKIIGATPSAYNGTYTFTVTGTSTFTYPLAVDPVELYVSESGYTPYNTTGLGTYTSGGGFTNIPNQQIVEIVDYPDYYVVTWTVPTAQTVNIGLIWNTIATNIVSSTAVAQLGAPAIANYINNISVGQPINVFEMQTVFQEAVSSIIPPQQLSKMVFTVTIDGVITAPISGTEVVYGDPESYFTINSALITIAQG
jgi:hypothetical protein